MDIFVCLDLTEEQKECLHGVASTNTLHLRDCVDEDAPLDDAFGECEICFGNPPAAWIGASPKLRWIQLELVGFGEYLDLDWSQLQSRLSITNLAGFFGRPVAETALAGILALYRGIDRLVELRHGREWQCDSLRPVLRSLHGSKVVLFGQGDINTSLQTMLAPFGCQIASFGRNWSANVLDNALSDSDIMVSAVPDTPVTRQVFGQRRLAKLQPGAILVNLGRGSVLDEEALVDRLESGKLGGAVLDVTMDEPLPSDHRFWRCPNLILTQHTGGGTQDETARKIDRFAQNLVLYLNKRPLIGSIDLEKGY